MRTFSCFTYEKERSVPTLSLIFAADEIRARILALRELADAPNARAVEVCENGKLLWAQAV